ncbi:MAG: Maf family protein [Planctomycetaceae bacterium]|jgi:septum formation protein|nr:Maf family protein [Planctomycetaceae bacterium]
MNILCNNNYFSCEKFYLASQSPRRRELLAETGLRFDILPPDEGIENERETNETPNQYVCRLAVLKARNVADKINYGCVIACDTVACCRDKLLGKPKDKNDAKQMLKYLRGKKHYVISGLCLLIKKISKPEQLTVIAERTELIMKQITDQELELYLDSNAWIGKAGAFGYQDGNSWIKIIKGSESNVVGLPIERLYEILNQKLLNS